MPKKKLSVSYSATKTWQDCEQSYWYRYIIKITPKVKSAAPELGTLIHTYLDEFYRGRLPERAKMGVEALHITAMRALKRAGANAKRYAQLASDMGMDEDAKALAAIPQIARDLMRAYYRVHGQKDLKQHKIVLVEDMFELPVMKGVVLPGRIDLVTKDKNGYWLWEHKSTGNIPRVDSRFRDLQTLVYAVALEELHGIKIAGIVWNYIHTRPPHEPRLLKNGTLSMAKATTTCELVRAASKRHKQDVSQSYLRKVEAQERNEMFQRFTLPVSASENILMRDYVHTVEDIRAVRADKDYVPIRNISTQCNWCSYVKLCQAVILGGDTDVLMRKYFTHESQEKGGETSGQEEDEVAALLEEA